MLRNKTPSVFKKPRPFALWHLGLHSVLNIHGAGTGTYAHTRSTTNKNDLDYRCAAI